MGTSGKCLISHPIHLTGTGVSVDFVIDDQQQPGIAKLTFAFAISSRIGQL